MPRVFEKVYNTAKQKAARRRQGQDLRRRAEHVAIAYSEALDDGGARARRSRPSTRLFDKLVYGKLRAALGGKVELRGVRRRAARRRGSATSSAASA